MDEALGEVQALAVQLGKAIRKHPRFITWREADARVRADKTATEALDAYNRLATLLARKERAGQPIEVEEKHQLQRLRETVAANDTIKAYMRTQADYAEMMRVMNDTIFEVIAAEDAPPKPQT